MKKLFSIIIAVLIMASGLSAAAFAEGENTSGEALGAAEKAVRTVMLYDCGADLETDGAMATFNLLQVLKANFSKDGSVRFIVMTGGSDEWQIEGKYLCEADGTPVEEVSSEYNQLWEAKGLDAPENEHPGKMVLLDGNGITGEGDAAVKSEDELMSDPETLKAFINYCHDNYPAEKYDLILWDHGGGPTGGFGVDQHDEDEETMPFDGLIKAFSDNKVTDSDSDGKQDGRFDFIDFDACLMSSVELTLVFAKYTDYYIASPETEPGYGQDYEGWLNMVGKDPSVNTYELGKKIVDDFYDFYETGYGKDQEGTLAIIDTRKFLKSDFVSALSTMTNKLDKQLTEKSDTLDLFAYYDELYSGENAIEYGMTSTFRDLGNLASLLGVSSYETTLEDVERDADNIRNTYSITSDWFDEILSDKKMMYARGTSGITSEDIQMIRKQSGIKYENLKTSGMYIFFPSAQGVLDAKQYVETMNNVFPLMDENDESTKVLKKYFQVVIKYNIMIRTGGAVSRLIEPDPSSEQEPLPKEDVTYDKVLEYWKEPIAGDDTYSLWNSAIKFLFDNLDGGEEGARTWLTELVKQQAAEAVDHNKVTAEKIQAKTGDKYQVTINETGRRVIDSVSQYVTAELPVLDDFKNRITDFKEKTFIESMMINLGTIEAYSDLDVDLTKTGDDLIKEIIKWNLGNVSKWDFDPVPDKWYAVNNAAGKNLVASIYTQTDDVIIIPTLSDAHYNEEANLYEGKMLLLAFDKKDGTLGSLGAMQENGSIREIDPEDITGEMTLKPILYYNLFGMIERFYPIASDDIVLSSKNYKDITLEYTDIKNIPDIDDIDGDGKAIRSISTIRDIYGSELNISKIIDDPAIKTVIGIDRAKVIDSTYTRGHKGEFMPTIKMGTKTLKEGVDYKFVLRDKFNKPGEYYFSIEGLGEYGGRDFCMYTVNKGVNPLKVKAKAFSIKQSALRKKAKTVKASKVIKTVSKGAGKVTYKKISGSKKITINKKTGKVTLKKGLKKGTYKIKVTVKAAGNSYYKAKTQKLTLKIKVI